MDQDFAAWGGVQICKKNGLFPNVPELDLLADFF